MTDTPSSEIVEFTPGERILTKGDPGVEAYIILEGRVRVFIEQDGKEVKLAELGESEIFGESSLFTEDGQYGAHVEAMEECLLRTITKEDFQAKLEACDPVLQTMFNLLIERQRRTNEALLKSETRAFMDIVLI